MNLDDETSAAGATRSSFPDRAASGQAIGPYTLMESIGEGGMGQVWLAEQKGPVRRRVALKLIKTGMDTREVVARFESERQALALMDHPAIAKVFDAGSTADGRPYFVMEYVAGLPITTYCDRHKLDTRQRLELMERVCEGVQHAHQKAIIHRDLKPSNILVTEVDGKPMPRIIDFGVAKATSQQLTDHTMYTHFGTIVGTLEYMSPEQADSFGRDVDTRSDVYSLGVILYELLVGALPFELRKLALDKALRLLREEEALRPSTKLRTLGEKSTETANSRGLDVPTLARQLQGDPDAIVMKAVEKDRARRYATPLELAQDIDRYLHNQPVQARPASTVYRARKYVQRHRLGVGAAVAGVLLLAGFAAMESLELRQIRRERDRADRVTKFMTDMFKVSDPSEARGNSITAREILDKAANEIDTGMKNDPVEQAQMLDVMGDVYSKLGLHQRSEDLYTQSLQLQQRALGTKNTDTLETMSQLGWEHYMTGKYAESEKLLREALQGEEQLLGENNEKTLLTMNHYAAIKGDTGHFKDAEDLHRKAREIARKVLGEQSRLYMVTSENLAHDLILENRYGEAESIAKQNQALAVRYRGEDHPDTLLFSSFLGWALEANGHYDEAERVLRDTIQRETRVLGPLHFETLNAKMRLGLTFANAGRYAEAEKVYRETLVQDEQAFGKDDPQCSITKYNLAGVMALEGNKDQALSVLRDAVDHNLEPSQDLGIATDDNFKSLAGDPQFTALVAHAKEVAGRASEQK